MRALVVGASGQVGALLFRSLSAQCACVGTYRRHAQPGLVPLDVRDGAAARALVGQARPDVVFLPAAFTAVDEAERRPAECRAVNVGGAVRLAEAVAATGGTMVLFSTDHVFGDSAAARREDEAPGPVNVYSRSKADAEAAVRALLPGRHLILRTAWVFGPDPQGKNFLCRVRRVLGSGERLVVPADQFGQPTFGPGLAQAALDLVCRGATGTFHVVGPCWLSRLEWARVIADQLGLPGHLIEGRTTAVLAPTAPRPLRVCLDRGKLLAALGRDPIPAPLAALRSEDESRPDRLSGSLSPSPARGG
jgi:dTDP-4-dehydrorhamnose reductase